eukprot:gb/GECG01002347.1/.p1 GENE.gb/GECG01002347.1/~~gb/GECG01002347.1/.p1  ORF type:complete len:108 (+),score=9.34 gb/GECG01002347.1/:1-324(+)
MIQRFQRHGRTMWYVETGSAESTPAFQYCTCALFIQNAGDKVSIIADWDGSLTRALDQEIDLSVGALGKRCKRFAGLIDDGSVKDISTESNPGEVTVSSAESLAERI